MEIDYTEITVKLMKDYTAKYLQENAELVQDTIKATQEALDIANVVGRSEHLVCNSWYSRDDKKHGLCENCGKCYKNHKAN